MPTPVLLLLVATLLPLGAFGLLAFVGKRMGSPLAGYVGTLFIGASFVASILAMILWYGGGTYQDRDWGFERGPVCIPIHWIPLAAVDHPAPGGLDSNGFLDVGIYLDSLTIMMFAMITLVATLVHIFSIGYMREDNRYPRFFTYLGLFCFSMLALVLSATMLQMFIFWELVGVCSYLLIGFWYEKKTATNAAIKAFIANRVGDFGFLLGFGILVYHLGNVTLPHMWIELGNAGGGGAITLADGHLFSSGMLTLMGIGLFFGAIGKSAQFPLHVWLPDAMEGPTPVSALIHAATMVAAGVYLTARIFPILTPDAKLFIAIIGCVTLTMGALIAVVQTDIKKVLAFSTLSQLGYMMLAMGVGSWVGGLFHLITHAFFKALLFLGSGSVIHAARHEQEMGEFGGLIRKIPVTGATFLVAVFAISGVGYGTVGFSGYYSKDMILNHAGAFVALSHHLGKSVAYNLLFILPMLMAFVTPFYMMRCWMMTFWGRPRHLKLFARAHESPTMWVPLVFLAVLAIISGKFMNVQEMIEGSRKETIAYCRQFDADFKGFSTAWVIPPTSADNGPAVTAITPAAESLETGAHWVERYLGIWGFTLGIGAAFLLYMRGLTAAESMLKFPPLRLLRNWLYGRMFFDELYFITAVEITKAAARLAGWFDRNVVDGIVNAVALITRQISSLAGLTDKYVVDGAVTSVGALANSVGAAARYSQTGRIRGYVSLLIAVVAVGLAAGILIVLAK